MAKPTLYTKQGTDKAIAKAIEPLATKEELARASAGGKVDLGELPRVEGAALLQVAKLLGKEGELVVGKLHDGPFCVR